MRLDGFGYLQRWKDDRLQRLLMSLALLDSKDVLEEVKQFEAQIKGSCDAGTGKGTRNLRERKGNTGASGH
jgi:hypothetical protein